MPRDYAIDREYRNDRLSSPMKKFPSPEHQAEYERQLADGLRERELSGIRQKALEIGVSDYVVARCMNLLQGDLNATGKDGSPPDFEI